MSKNKRRCKKKGSISMKILMLTWEYPPRVVGIINALQSGKYAESYKRYGNKDTYKNFPCKICLRSRSPVNRTGDQTDLH